MQGFPVWWQRGCIYIFFLLLAVILIDHATRHFGEKRKSKIIDPILLAAEKIYKNAIVN
jgi:hypothetical protein